MFPRGLFVQSGQKTSNGQVSREVVMAPGAGQGRQLAGVTWRGWFPGSAQVMQATSFGQISHLRPAWVHGQEAISYQDRVVK